MEADSGEAACMAMSFAVPLLLQPSAPLRTGSPAKGTWHWRSDRRRRRLASSRTSVLPPCVPHLWSTTGMPTAGSGVPKHALLPGQAWLPVCSSKCMARTGLQCRPASMLWGTPLMHCFPHVAPILFRAWDPDKLVLMKAIVAIAEPPPAAVRPPAKRKAGEPIVLARRKSCPAVPPKLEFISEASAKGLGCFLVVYGQAMRWC